MITSTRTITYVTANGERAYDEHEEEELLEQINQDIGLEDLDPYCSVKESVFYIG